MTYTYDTATNGVQKLASVTRGDVQTSYTYNERGTVDTETKTIGTDVFATSYDYDRQGREESRTYPDSSVLATTYNNAGLTESLTIDSTPIVSSVAYTAQGTPGTITYGNGTTTTNTYDLTKRGRLSSRVTTKGATTLQDLAYTYDGTGNILQIDDGSGSATDKISTYAYDDLNRMTSFSTSGLTGGDVSRSYAYSALGNMTSHPVHGALTYGNNTNANPHALDGDGINTWVYDANGNVTGDGAQTYTWNYRNEMEGSDDGTTSYAYTYDQSGDRVVKQEDSNSPTFYIGDYVYDEQADEHEIHIALAGVPVFERKTDTSGDTDVWMHADHLDSVAVMTSDVGTETARTDYWPFGGLRYESGTDENRFDFTNKERDESGLNYFEARYLDTDLGRFRSLDPVFLHPTAAWILDPQAQNAYAYARNNPVKYIDPDGHAFWNKVSAIAATAINVVQAAGDFVSFGQYSKAVSGVQDAGSKMANEGVSVSTVANATAQVAFGTARAGGAALVEGVVSGVAAGAKVISVGAKALNVGADLGKVGRVVENSSQAITGYSKHGLNRKISRAVSSKTVLNTVKNPLITISQSSGRTLRLSRDAGVVLSNSGKVVTTYGKKQFNSTVRKIVNKMK